MSNTSIFLKILFWGAVVVVIRAMLFVIPVVINRMTAPGTMP